MQNLPNYQSSKEELEEYTNSSAHVQQNYYKLHQAVANNHHHIQYVQIMAMTADDPGRQPLVEAFFDFADKAGVSYLGEAWGADGEHMKNRKGNDIMVWACSACGKSFYSFDGDDLAKRKTAHETLWCPKTGAEQPYSQQ